MKIKECHFVRIFNIITNIQEPEEKISLKNDKIWKNYKIMVFYSTRHVF
jgi:hypothetical protein